MESYLKKSASQDEQVSGGHLLDLVFKSRID